MARRLTAVRGNARIRKGTRMLDNARMLDNVGVQGLVPPGRYRGH